MELYSQVSSVKGASVSLSSQSRYFYADCYNGVSSHWQRERSDSEASKAKRRSLLPHIYQWKVSMPSQRFAALVKVKSCVSLRVSGSQYEGSIRIIQDFELEAGGAVNG